MRRTAWIAIAAILAVVSLLASAAAFTAQPDPDALPSHVRLPEPRVGDRAHYEVRQVVVDDGWLLTPFIVDGVDAEWMPPAVAVDAWGVERTVAPLRLRADYHWFDGSYSSTLHQLAEVDVATWTTVAVTNDESFPEEGARTGQVAPGVSVFGGPAVAEAWFETRMLQGSRAPCAFAGPLFHGVGDGETHLGGRCGRPLLNEPAGDRFRLAAKEDVAGIPTVRFDNVDHPEVRVWVNPGLPFPVKVRDNFVDLWEAGKTGCCVFELTLAGYAAGAMSYTAEEPQGTPSTLPVAPADRGLSDETGAPHPFPASAALAAVLAHPDGVAYARAHPDAYVGESHAWHTVDEAGRVAWHHNLLLTDGRTFVGKHVFQDHAGQAADATGLGLLQDPTQVPVRIEPWDGGLDADVTGLYPLPADVPTSLPRVADALDAFLASANETIRAKEPGWGVVHACFGDCARPFSYVRVNVIQVPVAAVTTVPDQLEPRGEANAALNARADGSILSHAKRTSTPDDPGLLGLGGDGGRGTARQASRAIAPAGGDVPYAPIAAVAGGLALAAFATWLAVGAQAAPGLGLFSRIEHDRLLDHKGRAGIVHAIEAEPGVHLQELARRTGIATGALRHHLGKLQAAGLVVARPLNGYLCYFAPAAARAPAALASAAARSEGARQVLEALQAGATGVREVAAATGLAPSTVSHHMERLRSAGLVVGDGRTGYHLVGGTASGQAAA